VYLTDVRIPDSQRLGAVGQGWGVDITTLMNERLTSGELRGPDFEELFELARTVELEDGPAIANAAVRERLADYYVRTQGVRWSRFRTMTALSRGDTPGPENSIGKLVNAPKAQDMASFALGLPGVAAVLAGQPHSRRHRRDLEEHHRRARARPAAGHPRRPRGPVRPAADQQALSGGGTSRPTRLRPSSSRP